MTGGERKSLKKEEKQKVTKIQGERETGTS